MSAHHHGHHRDKVTGQRPEVPSPELQSPELPSPELQSMMSMVIVGIPTRGAVTTTIRTTTGLDAMMATTTSTPPEVYYFS